MDAPRTPHDLETSGDEEFLDELFERFVAARAGGTAIDRAAVKSQRPDLAERIDALWRVASGFAGDEIEVQQVGDYRVLHEIGRGGMSVVFLARQEKLGGREVALKVRVDAVVPSAGDRRRFLAEARALARIRHPHVVEIYDVVEEEGLQAFAMEWVTGGSLADLQRRRRGAGPPESTTSAGSKPATDSPERMSRSQFVPWVCRLGIQIARALEAMHGEGLVHRDVKPSNILLRDDGTPLLSDFGVVRDPTATHRTHTGAFIGTAVYAAPEQLRGDTADRRSDVYGLGVTLFQTLTDELPVRGRSEAELLRQLETRGPTNLRTVDATLSRDLEAVLAKALEPNPSARYASAAEMADDLERVLALQPIHARRQDVWVRSWKWLRRQRGQVAAAALGAILVAVAAAWWVGESERRERAPLDAAALVREAHLALLDTRLAKRADLGLTTGEAAFVELVRRQTERAVELFGEALELQPRSEVVQAERHAAALASCLLRGESGEVHLQALRADHPLTTHRAERLLPSGPPHEIDTDLTAAAERDLRTAGLFAFLTGDLRFAVEAWNELERRGGEDPFVLGLLGFSHLKLGASARAYPRLVQAAEAFPEAGFLEAAAARAALLCGDRDVAERRLERARAAALPASDEDLRTLRADLAWSRGDLDRALETYVGSALPNAYERTAEAHLVRGEWADAVYAYSTRISNDPHRLELRREFLRVVRGWWRRLDPDQRREVLAAGLRGERGVHGNVFGVLVQAQDSCDRLRNAFTDEIAPLERTDTPYYFDRELAERDVRDGSFDAFAEWIDARRIDVEVIAERRELGEQLLDAWLVAEDSIAAQALLRENGALLPEGAHAYGPVRAPITAPMREVAELVGITQGFPQLWTRSHTTLGDIDGDGAPDYLAGALELPHHPAVAGRLCVYSGADGSLLREHVGDGLQRLGLSVALMGDLDGDGVSEYASPIQVLGEQEQEFLRMYSGRTGAIVGAIQIGAGALQSGGSFVSLGTRDSGRSILCVGHRFDSSNGDASGTVRAYTADGEPLWTVFGEEAQTHYGNQVANVGDRDGDGRDDVLVSINRMDVNGEGFLDLLSGADGSRLRRIGPDHMPVGAIEFVRSLGDVDGDGRTDLFLQHAGGAVGVGFHSLESGHPPVIVNGDRPGFGLFRTAVGDLDGDGCSEVAITSLDGRSPYRPVVWIFSARGQELARLDGFVRICRLGFDPLLPPPEDRRLVALGIECWSRYSPSAIGGKAHAVLLEFQE